MYLSTRQPEDEGGNMDGNCTTINLHTGQCLD